MKALTKSSEGFTLTLVEDPSPWRKCWCKLMTHLGDFLSAGRRRSWAGDRLFVKYPMVYWGIKRMLLYGRLSDY